MTLRLAIAGLLAVAGCGGAQSAGPPRPASSTLVATLADRNGDGFLEPAPGEPLRDRRELGGGGRPIAVIATFAQLTDTHVRDEESPARVPFLDRLGKPLDSTFRPQEALSAQVLDAAVRALRRLRPQATVVTGDIADSAQENELDQALSLLDGGRVDPGSGARGYDGVQEAGNPDPLIYRPYNDAPRHPGMLDAAQQPFSARGLGAPWYPALGNHDLQVQGILPPSERIRAVARGSRLLTQLDPGVRPDPRAGVRAQVDALLDAGAPGRARTVPPDSRRGHLSPARVAAALAATSGPARTRAGRLDYVFDLGPDVRGLVLDTVNRRGGSRGVLAPAQVAWLRARLRAAGDRHLLVFSHNALDATAGGAAALAALERAPGVVAAIAGNRHRNTIAPRRGRGSRGFWLVGTSSLADFPQQGRFFRLVRTGGGGVALETFMVDHDGRGLAGIARELAHLDAQGGRPQRFAGARADRNARLHLPAR